MDYYDGELLAKNLKIPLRTENFYQKGLIDSSLAFIPVYHLTKSSQTVQQISAQFNKVPVTSLKLWNGIPKTGIVSGMQILVGYLRALPEQVAYFEESIPHYLAVVEKPKIIIPKPEKKIDSVAIVVKDKPKVKEDTKVVIETKKPVDSTSIAKENKPAKKDPNVTVTQPKEKPKTVTTNPNEETKKPTTEPSKPVGAKLIHVGLFQDVYKPSIPKEKVLTGDAALFESNSGWQNGKYYVLIPKLKPGAIVKISYANKVLYAKVLGELPVDDEKGILLRLSNAAANELGVKDAKFPVVVTY
jgi:hypothetical protein